LHIFFSFPVCSFIKINSCFFRTEDKGTWRSCDFCPVGKSGLWVFHNAKLSSVTSHFSLYQNLAFQNGL